MLELFSTAQRHVWIWGAIAVVGLSMEAVALFFQYQLNCGPCVLCVHVRAWVAAIIVLALLGIVSKNCVIAQRIQRTLFLLATGGMLERSYVTLGVERGFIDGACSLQSGFPAWLPLDQWAPILFEPWEACGYTPELLLGITMAEGLIALSFVMVTVAVILLIDSLKQKGSLAVNL